MVLIQLAQLAKEKLADFGIMYVVLMLLDATHAALVQFGVLVRHIAGTVATTAVDVGAQNYTAVPMLGLQLSALVYQIVDSHAELVEEAV